MSTFPASNETYINIEFSLKEEQTELTRFVDPAPFVPGNKADAKNVVKKFYDPGNGIENVWSTPMLPQQWLEFPVDWILHWHCLLW